MKHYQKSITILIISVLSVLLSLNALAQENSFTAGTNMVKVGIGVMSGMNDVAMPPVHISYEKGVWSISEKFTLGVGGFAGMLTTRFIDETSVIWGTCLNGNIHFALLPKLDLYAGYYLGYVSLAEYGFSMGDFSNGFMLGASYFFTSSVGAFVQLGGFGSVSAGVAFSF